MHEPDATGVTVKVAPLTAPEAIVSVPLLVHVDAEKPIPLLFDCVRLTVLFADVGVSKDSVDASSKTAPGSAVGVAVGLGEDGGTALCTGDGLTAGLDVGATGPVGVGAGDVRGVAEAVGPLAGLALGVAAGDFPGEGTADGDGLTMPPTAEVGGATGGVTPVEPPPPPPHATKATASTPIDPKKTAENFTSPHR